MLNYEHSSAPDYRIKVSSVWFDGSVSHQQAVLSFVEAHAWSTTFVMAPFAKPLNWPESLRFQALPEDELFATQGVCLCCALKSPLADALRHLFMSALTKQQSKVNQVYILTRSNNTKVLVQTLKHAPFLAHRYRFGEHLCMKPTI